MVLCSCLQSLGGWSQCCGCVEAVLGVCGHDVGGVWSRCSGLGGGVSE